MSTPEKPQGSYKQRDALRDALAALNRAPARPSVTISRDGNGNYSYDVRVTADDVGEAMQQAITVEQALAYKFPAGPQESDPHKIELARNAKGETQIVVKGDTGATELYETLRARYPLNDGTVSHDKPKEAGK